MTPTERPSATRARRSRGIIAPILPDFDPDEWVRLPLAERGRQVCQSWAKDGYGTPYAVYLAYLVKAAAYIVGWFAFCQFSESLGGLATIGEWWSAPDAFKKAILFSMLFEGLGLGCGSGPLTGRYVPPIGGILYWLRPGTLKLPVFPWMPLIGDARRGVIAVLLYAALVVSLVRALVAPEVGDGQLWPVFVLLPALGVLDRTQFLAFRAEHYLVTVAMFLFAGNWIAGAKAVQLALWFFAGFSKLNHHFPSVVCVMTSNSPMTRGTPLRRWVYRDAPTDLRPSALAVMLAHVGTAVELLIPLMLLLAPSGPWLVAAVVLACALHAHITSSVPMGVPIEWNITVVYGLFALFWAHPEVTVWDIGNPTLVGMLAFPLLFIPLAGNVAPERLSFLLSMRYYAGNWPYGVWLFRGDSYRKLDRLTKPAPWVVDQLRYLYDEKACRGIVSKVMAFRMMHLQGRALPQLLPRAVNDLAAYEYVDGEIVAGLALGWNFGDGHLHNEQLLTAIQEACGFEAGELRCIFVEAQPLGSPTMRYRIRDAKDGLLEAGQLDVAELRELQPWEASDRAIRD